MKTVLEYLYKNHVKNVTTNEFTLYKSVADENKVYVKLNKIDDLDILNKDIQCSFINEIKKGMRQMLLKQLNTVFLARPILEDYGQHAISWTALNDNRHICLNKTITINEFTFNFWKLNKWTVKPII